MIMNMSFPQKIIVLCIVILLPSHSVMAGSFSDILRVMGISVAPSGVRGAATILQGNLWLSKIDGTGAHRPVPITRDGTYHSPLWIPGSSQILAIKGNKLVQLDTEGNGEKVLYPLADSITLHGFDKRDAKSVLILQNSVPAVLSLANGKTTFLPYDKENEEDRTAAARLSRDFRSYGHVKVFVESQPMFDELDNEEGNNKIHIIGKQIPETVIPCPEYCIQPALSENGRQLVFVGP